MPSLHVLFCWNAHVLVYYSIGCSRGFLMLAAVLTYTRLVYYVNQVVLHAHTAVCGYACCAVYLNNRSAGMSIAMQSSLTRSE